VKKIVFITGTRADYSKIKSLVTELQKKKLFKVYLFLTGMHNLKEFGSTYLQILSDKIKNVVRFKNQKFNEPMNQVFINTHRGFTRFVKKNKPDLIIVHGDRTEALACAVVGVLSGIKVAHIEGGELSGTVDEILRHSITKLSNIHFVSTRLAKKRLIQLGEQKNLIHVVGSPDIDIALKSNLPNLDVVKKRYSITFEKYAIAILHPVTTEYDILDKQVKIFLKAIKNSKLNYILIFPNNDLGVKKIVSYYKKIKSTKIKKLPSMRFEYYLTLLKNSDFIIGNSSSGIIEAPYFGVPTINIGTRQKNRSDLDSIINSDFNLKELLKKINKVKKIRYVNKNFLFNYGRGDSFSKFFNIINNKDIWSFSNQKYFKDLDFDMDR
jgi:UDP-N-acetylglucosamine 2-epimerase (hydrolysing)